MLASSKVKQERQHCCYLLTLGLVKLKNPANPFSSPKSKSVTSARVVFLLGLDDTVAFLCWLLVVGEAGGIFGQLLVGLEEDGVLLCWLLMELLKEDGFLCWMLMGLGEEDGLLWAEPEGYGGF